MNQIITAIYSGENDENDTLDFQWDANWRPKHGPNPFKALSDFELTKKGNWDELCAALVELMTVNGQKMSAAELSTRLRGKWVYMVEIVEGVIASAMRQLKGKIR